MSEQHTKSSVQTQEYLGRVPKKKKARWLLTRPYYDPRTDGLTLGGSTELEGGERHIGTLGPGEQCLLSGDLVTVVGHSNYMTVVSVPVSRTIRTKGGQEADITSDRTKRVPSSVIVSVDFSTVESLTKNQTESQLPVRRVGTQSQRDLDQAAREAVESLLLEGGRKYSEVHALVRVRVPGWSRSVSWVSNIAYYMRKDGRLKK